MGNVHIKIVCICFLWLMFALPAYPWTDGQDAALVLGQDNFTTRSGGTSVKDFRNPRDVAIDAKHGKIYVCDDTNNRILRFPYPVTANHPEADLVFGQNVFTTSSSGTSQSTFDSPRGVAVDGTGRLWVADTQNNRVIWFDRAYSYTSNRPDANGVLGQSGFISRTGATTRNGMRSPYDMAFDANGRLFVADAGNNRILRFDRGADVLNGTDADAVLGQPDYLSNASATSRDGMSSPRGVAVYGTALFVADTNNERVLRFDDVVSKRDGGDADSVLGKPDFITDGSGTTQSDLGLTGRVVVDGSGRLYASDSGSNDRILIFNDVLAKTSGADADQVIGQPNFTSSGGIGVTEDRLNMASVGGGMALDPLNNILAVSDDDNNRVMLFEDTISGPALAVKTGITYLPDGGTYDFGEFDEDADNDIIFTIENPGDELLELSGTPPVRIDGDDAGHFSIETQPDPSVDPGEKTTFSIRFISEPSGTATAQIVIENNDADDDDDTYRLDITGEGPESNGTSGSCFFSVTFN